MTYEEAYRIAADWAMRAHTQYEKTGRRRSATECAERLGISVTIMCHIFYETERFDGDRVRQTRGPDGNIVLREPIAIIPLLIPHLLPLEISHEQACPDFRNGRYV